MSASDPRCFACHSCCGAWTEEGSLRVFVKKRPLSLKLHGGGDEWEYLETMLDSGATVTVIPLLAQVWDFFAVRYFAANASARRGAWLDVVILADMWRACKLKLPMCPTLCIWGECLSKRDTSWCSAMETKAASTTSTTRRLASQTPFRMTASITSCVSTSLLGRLLPDSPSSRKTEKCNERRPRC